MCQIDFLWNTFSYLLPYKSKAQYKGMKGYTLRRTFAFKAHLKNK